ncbi:MAG: flagellar motor protein MotD [Nitrospira sp.]|nr:flagellar motor protein MotD [Nitrospira sp.]
MAKKPKHEEHENHERWLVSYADFITLLFAFFVVMYSTSMINEGKFKVFSKALQEAFVPQIRVEVSSNQRYDVGEGKSAIIPAIHKKVYFMTRAQSVVKKAVLDLDLKEKLKLTATEGGILITIEDSLLFEGGRADVKPESLPILEALAEVLADAGDDVKEIRVEGHSDNVPLRNAQFSSNWELSSLRAVTVVRVLTELHKVPPQKTVAVGYGEFKPVADNLTPESRAKNRRVELNVFTW